MSNESSGDSTSAQSSQKTHSVPSLKLDALFKFGALKRALSGKASTKESKEFPPTSWELENSKNEGTGASSWSYNPDDWNQVILRLRNKYSSPSEAPETPGTPVEPTTAAMKIRQLIANIPIPSLPGTPFGSTKNQPTTNIDQNVDQPLVDDQVAKVLVSEKAMNGDGKNEEGIFSILRKLRPTRGERSAAQAGDETAELMEDEREGIMLCSPLQPTQDTLPELAESELELEYVDEPEPISGDTNENRSSQPNTSSSTTTAEKKTKVRRTWHPSPTKISIQATWWGYRLYLPPPVLGVLSDAHLAAAKRGAMVTAALKWAIDRVPLPLVPPALRPAIAMLKRLTPYLGYVGAFVAWGWEKVKRKDEGYGVVLTATWLLPIGLIPATWDPKVHGHVQERKAEEGAPDGHSRNESSKAAEKERGERKNVDTKA